MPTYIRLTDYKSSDEKKQEFFNPENRYEAKQEDFEKIPGSPIAYWVSDKINFIFENNEMLNDIATTRVGLQTGNNARFVRSWFECSSNLMSFTSFSREASVSSCKKWFPYNKGGEYRRWYGNQEFIVNWEDDGKELFSLATELYGSPTRTIKNAGYYFQKSITWSKVSSGKVAFRYQPSGAIFDVAGASVFINDDKVLFTIALLNTKLALKIFNILSPTLNYETTQIGKMPMVFSNLEIITKQIETIAQQNIDISKEEWDSRETSWDFTASPLVKSEELRVKSCKIEDAYNAYCDYWREKFFTLHKNEEELNRLFIDIYELQDELTPEVELKDITILKNEAKIVDGELVFQADEILKQFISYGVGVMFGRYSLESDGILIANMGQEVPTDTTFEIDDDNVIPVLEDNYFTDDIASRFVSFVKTTFGEEHLGENLQFIENALGVTLRKYFVKGFYEDHIKRYKKRPIYWMVASPKKGFMSLMYMHRYTSDIFATVQNAYVREYITKLEAKKEDEQRNADDDSNSPQQRNRASKEVEKINKILEEVIKFDRETLTAFAQNRVEIDLDDGVKVNYCKFKDVLFEYDKKLCK